LGPSDQLPRRGARAMPRRDKPFGESHEGEVFLGEHLAA
jgi:hypothetical protein